MRHDQGTYRGTFLLYKMYIFVSVWLLNARILLNQINNRQLVWKVFFLIKVFLRLRTSICTKRCRSECVLHRFLSLALNLTHFVVIIIIGCCFFFFLDWPSGERDQTTHDAIDWTDWDASKYLYTLLCIYVSIYIHLDLTI